jgi:hypothetical protein
MAVLMGIALTWPMFASGGIYTFPDTSAYLRGGEVIWSFIADAAGRLAPEAAAPGPSARAALEGAALDDGQGPVVVRSIAYSFVSYSLYQTGGAFLLAVAQGALAVFTVFAFVGPLSGYRTPVLIAGTALIVAATSLPWFAVYMMPDIFAAVIVLFAALLLGRFDALTPAQKLVLTAIAAFATASHYGNPPLAFGLFGLAIFWRLIRGRWSTAALAAALVPIMFTPLANLTVSWAALDRPSTSPLRLPILLARSIEDGPARWYLEEACPEADLAVCALFGAGAPDGISEFLWSDRGIEGLPRETVQRIVDEEYTVLLGALRAYPLQQTASLLENAVEQLGMLRLDDLQLHGGMGEGFRPLPPDDPGADAAIKHLGDLGIAVTTLGSLALFVLAWASGRTRDGDVEVMAMLLLGLMLNALIFGGLSAPADRYQARIVWIVPVMVLLVVARAGPWAVRARVA